MDRKDGGSSRARDALLGFINALMTLPVMISFCHIIYKNQVDFGSYMPTLVKLTLFSASVHQLCFTLFSSMPFAVGQVQDAGLIFLSAMAEGIASYCAEQRPGDGAAMISTTVVLLSVATTALGVALIIVGRLRLASYVQYLPMPVVGGYLAYIGLFCGESGLAMMANVELRGVTEWYKLLSAPALLRIAPGVASGCGMYYAVRRFRHMLTLPACMAAVLAAFFAVLFLSGGTLESARRGGWIAEAETPASVADTWEYFRFDAVLWGALPSQLLSWTAMFLVVAFSSSLDVAAIEMELGTPLDYNRELTTVGISNLASGLSGGYTGSYIFSQTIFNLRAGVDTRWTGMLIAGTELLIFLMPFSAVAYVPKCFFGSLLVLICVDLCYEWLVEARHKMAVEEYAVCLLTFCAVNAFGVEGGMGVGVLLAMACFTFAYAQLPALTVPVARTSLVTRTFPERIALDKAAHSGRMIVFSLQGYIFFGSAVSLLRSVKERIKWPGPRDPPPRLEVVAAEQDRPLRAQDRPSAPWPAQPSYQSADAPPTPQTPRGAARRSPAGSAGGGGTTEVMAVPVYNRGGGDSLQIGHDADARRERGSPRAPLDERTALLAGRALDVEAQRALASSLLMMSPAGADATQWVVLDFERVSGVDATAARSCFLILRKLLQSAKVQVAFSAMSPKVSGLLAAHGVVDPVDDPIFRSAEEALEWCEEQLLQRAAKEASSSPRAGSRSPSESPRRSFLGAGGGMTAGDEPSSPGGFDERVRGRRVARLQKRLSAGDGAALRPSASDDGLFLAGGGEAWAELGATLRGFVEASGSGEEGGEESVPKAVVSAVPLLLDGGRRLTKYFGLEAVREGVTLFESGEASGRLYLLRQGEVELLSDDAKRIQKISDGGVCGEVGFFLGRPQAFRAVTRARCQLWFLSRAKFAIMCEEEPKLAMLLQHAILRSLSLSISENLLATLL